MENNTTPEQVFLGMSQLARKWGCHRDTLSDYIKRLSEHIPLYRKGQKIFAPVQYKKLAELLGFTI